MNKKVVITISGGNVQDIMTNDKDVDVVIVDYDTDGLEEEMMTEIPQGDGSKENAHVYVYEGITQAEYEPERVEEIFKAVNRD